jgi:hypothetical protein
VFEDFSYSLCRRYSPKFVHSMGCCPLQRAKGPAAIRLRLLPEIRRCDLWSGQLLAGLLLSLLLSLLLVRFVLRLFLLGCLLGTKLGVEHG